MCFSGLAILPAVLEQLLPVAPVVLAGVPRVGLAVLFVGCQNLLPVRRIIFSLPVQDLISVLEVTETANCGTTGFAVP